jgi:hypothetical protein
MWICVRCIERDMDILETTDNKAEIFDLMYKDMCIFARGEGNLIDLINSDNAELSDDLPFGWMNHKGCNYDWKCFWI